MKRFRKVLFWAHLVIGLAAGSTIAVTVFTGACMAFEKQVIAWAERDVRRVNPPAPEAPRLPLDPIVASIRKAQPQAQLTSFVISADPKAAITFALGRTNTVYVNPYTGDLQPQGAPRLRAFFQRMLRWHRWLGVSSPPPRAGTPSNEPEPAKDNRDATSPSRNGTPPPAMADAMPLGEPTAEPGGERREGPRGRREFMGTVMGVSAAIFCTLAISGLCLWWPRALTLQAFRAVSFPTLRYTGKARDWNWHNAVGFWASPLIIVMSLTGMAMAFRPFGTVLYGSGGPTPGPGGNATHAASLTPPEPGMRPLGPDALFAVAIREVPHWDSVTVRMGGRAGRGRSGRLGAQRPDSPSPGADRGTAAPVDASSLSSGPDKSLRPPEFQDSERRDDRGRPGAGGRIERGTPAVSISILERDSWFPHPIQLQVHPFTGEVLQRTCFADQVAEQGLRRALRGLNRTLHTGEAGGLPGQALALFACSAGLVLVYTGFALSWRRFRQRKSPGKPSPPTAI